MELLFSEEEFIMLSLLLGADKIVGIEDNESLLKKSAAELQDIWVKVKVGLQEKRYIGNEQDQTLEVDAAVYHLLSICHHPELLFTAQMTEHKAESLHTNYYFNADGIVSLTIHSPEGSRAQIALKHYEKVTDVTDHLEKTWNPYATNYADTEEFVETALSKSKYFSFIAALNMKNLVKAAELLTTVGLNEEDAQDAASGFINKGRFVTFCCSRITDEVEVSKMIMFYFGVKACWIIEVPSGEDTALKLTKASVEQCLQPMKQLIMTQYGSLATYS
ncbi:hypothetical protein [Paenibacillus andongensis]|uniref:hypothetical protein n=1 Tax=Paenibacillus andongensis TaxID=2975482 RepID=UPI0021BB031C|nr:hypothetical protein [Paenibacillus andongensis]